MVYRRNYRGRYRRRRRRYVRKQPTRGSVYGAAARQLYRDVSKLKSMINVEYKFHDYSSSNNLTSTPVINCINFVNEGDTDQTHDGAMFRIKSLQLNSSAALSAGTTDPISYRMAIVLDTDAAASTTAPTFADIYDSTGSAINAFRNLDNRSRFVMLRQWTITLQPGGKESNNIKYFKSLDLKSQIVGTATETNLRKNGLYLVMYSTNAAAGVMTLDVTTRIRYIDN